MSSAGDGKYLGPIIDVREQPFLLMILFRECEQDER
jgi:hypothetical protein